MHGSSYRFGNTRPKRRSRKPIFIAILVLLIGGFLVWKFVLPSPIERTISSLKFDDSVSEDEKQKITQAITNQNLTISSDTTFSVRTTTEPETTLIVGAYVPVTGFYDSRQTVTSAELKEQIDALPGAPGTVTDIDSTSVTLIPFEQLTDKVKLLNLDGQFYLDSFNRGAVFRQAVFTSSGASALDGLKFSGLPSKESVLKINQTGVTALTRLMMRKLSSVGDATYFSAKIGDFLADADITHVSNEVSFREGCGYSNVSFCSPMEFIETLKDSGVDLVEITGNHNNDNGSSYNTDTIEMYRELGWNTFGGGLNKTEAAKPYIADQKGSKIAFLGYNMADGLGSGAIATDTTAGANYYTEEKAKADITAAKQNSQFVIVDIQYAECQAYPSGYVEFPECDGPISGQQEDFQKIIDLGADMVIGSSAHQPQTYELYKGKPIYYGLGNLYFEQTQWPGTERGIVLTHYFSGGKLLQTKLTPTEYHTEYQTAPMSDKDAVWLLGRLKNAR